MTRKSWESCDRILVCHLIDYQENRQNLNHFMQKYYFSMNNRHELTFFL